MSDGRAASFLAGERLDDVAIYLPEESISDPSSLLEQDYAERVADGVLIVVDGEQGRSVFGQITGADAMTFAGTAMKTPGTVSRDLTAGECPNAVDGPQAHEVEFIFSFAEAQSEDAGGIYAEGDVIHAYAQCTCGEAYADKWVVGDE